MLTFTGERSEVLALLMSAKIMILTKIFVNHHSDKRVKVDMPLAIICI